MILSDLVTARAVIVTALKWLEKIQENRSQIPAAVIDNPPDGTPPEVLAEKLRVLLAGVPIPDPGQVLAAVELEAPKVAAFAAGLPPRVLLALAVSIPLTISATLFGAERIVKAYREPEVIRAMNETTPPPPTK